MTALHELLAEYELTLAYTDSLWRDLSPDEVAYRTDTASSAIGWHLLHQPAVAHFMIRNLILAEPRLDHDLEALADSATPPSQRGELPPPDNILAFRTTVATQVRARIRHITDSGVASPNQPELVGQTLLVAVINHEYQHSTWIAEVRGDLLNHAVPPLPDSRLVTILDGYPIVGFPS